MQDLQLSDLVNEEQTKAVLLNNGDLVEASTNQGFQVLPKTVELWEKLEDGRLLRLKRWIKSRSILAYY
ncbi:MAG: hypothetical protein GJ680_07705 [Alteromonadaceae bacterium]|nr:hypothetical protein [Alteromonadaceae bacterium]